MSINAMKKYIVIFIVIACFLSQSTYSANFIDEAWDSGTPASCWPCKQNTCNDPFNGWESYPPAELGGSGSVPESSGANERHVRPETWLTHVGHRAGK